MFHTLFWPLEFTVPGRDNNKCYAKIICNKLDSVGFCHSPPPFWTESSPSSKAFSLAVGPSHRVPLPGSERWRGDSRLQHSHEVRSDQGAARRDHRYPSNLCWGASTSTPFKFSFFQVSDWKCSFHWWTGGCLESKRDWACLADQNAKINQSANIFKYIFPPAEFHHSGCDQELRWKHHQVWLLRLNPAGLASCSQISSPDPLCLLDLPPLSLSLSRSLVLVWGQRAEQRGYSADVC